MVTIKSIETKEMKVWIEQHNEFFILKHQEAGKEVQALNAISNLTLVLQFFDTLVGKDRLLSN